MFRNGEDFLFGGPHIETGMGSLVELDTEGTGQKLELEAEPRASRQLCPVEAGPAGKEAWVSAFC